MSRFSSLSVLEAAPAEAWYPILESRRVSRRPVGVTRFGRDLVVWRGGDGSPVAAPDRCPHRGMALSGGRVVDGEIECPWHGFRYAADGACRRIPCSGRDVKIPSGLSLDPIPVREEYGLVWMWWGEDREGLPAVPWFAELDDDLSATSGLAFELPYAWDRMMESNLDIHHVPFLHRRSLPGIGTLLDPFEVELEGDEVRCWGHMRKEDGRSVEESPGQAFRVTAKLPMLVLIAFGSALELAVAVTPVDEERSWVFGRYYHRYTRLPGLKKLLPWLAIEYDRWVVQPQDWRGFAALRERRFDREAFRLVASDEAILAYFRLVERARDEREPGRAPVAVGSRA